ncbi:MAG: hypothetical protein GY803_13485 [Chloroflexi bacterium]|nr:hypothetical protein [Chloroflexota bacterium]
MSDADLAGDLRQLLDTYGMTAESINDAIGKELKETQIEALFTAVIANINLNKIAFSANLNNALTARGATWNGVVYNLAPLGLSFGLKLAATEELSAIRTHAPTPGFDAAKALTNLLRLIKAAER